MTHAQLIEKLQALREEIWLREEPTPHRGHLRTLDAAITALSAPPVANDMNKEVREISTLLEQSPAPVKKVTREAVIEHVRTSYFGSQNGSDFTIGEVVDKVSIAKIADAILSLLNAERSSARNEELERDAKRLDWLEAEGATVEWDVFFYVVNYASDGTPQQKWRGDTVRAAIDSAMQSEAPAQTKEKCVRCNTILTYKQREVCDACLMASESEMGDRI